MSLQLYSQQKSASNPAIPKAPAFGFEPPSMEVDPMSPDGNTPAFSDPMGDAARTFGKPFGSSDLGGLKPPVAKASEFPAYNAATNSMIGGTQGFGTPANQSLLPTGQFGGGFQMNQGLYDGTGVNSRPSQPRQGSGVPLDFKYRGTYYSTDGQGQSYVNGRASGRSENEIVRKYLRANGIKPRIDARATLSERANREF